MFSELYDWLFPLVAVKVIGKQTLITCAYYTIELPSKERVDIRMGVQWAEVGDTFMLRRGFFEYF